jgi:ribosomal protein S18 acetylase RimI-like enzyme
MDVQIIHMGPADAHLLDHVADDVFDAKIDPDRLGAFLAEPRHLMVIAVSDGVVVGQGRAIIHLSPDQADELYIDNMGVAPVRQREGIGGRILDELLAWARERGCDYAWLGTEDDNVPARALYESRGSKGAPMVIYEYDDLDDDPTT